MASPRGKRSLESLARRFISDKSYHDPIMAETISKTTKEMVVRFLNQKRPDEAPPKMDVVRGEVLIDSRGRGSFQK